MSGVLITLWACAAGCALFDTGGWRSVGEDDEQETTLLKPIEAAVPRALRLEYQIIERPADDPLMGGILWDELVEMGIVEHETRRALNDCGMRVGVASSQPPAALEKLRGNLAQIVDPTVPGNARRRSEQVITLPDGGHVDAQTGNVMAKYTTTIQVGGETEQRTFEKARGVMVVTAHVKQEGWATITFAPEIRYGAVLTRPVVGTSGWTQFETGQSVHKLPKQRFKLTLVEGDSVIVSSIGEADHRIGDLFFRDVVDGVPVQRMLVVRLLGTDAPVIQGE